MELAATFAAMPGATPLPGLSDAWHWGLAPGFDFAAALTSDGEHAFQLYALDSYDEALVTAVLAFAREHAAELISPPARPLTLVEGFSYPGVGFDAVVAIGPGVHKYHPKDKEVHEHTRALLPAFRCEFAGDEDEDDTQYRYARAAGVPATRLDREPRPYLKLRSVGDDGKVPRKRGFAGFDLLPNEVRRLESEPERFVEIENYRHEVRRIAWDGQFVFGGDGVDEQRSDFDGVLDTAREFLYGPNLAAARG